MTPSELMAPADRVVEHDAAACVVGAIELRSYAELTDCLTWMANRGIVAIDPRHEDECVLVDPPKLTQLARELGWPGLEEA